MHVRVLMQLSVRLHLHLHVCTHHVSSPAGDAIYMARMWAGEVALTACLDGDINQRNGFTLGDAVFLAGVWTGTHQLPWATATAR